MNLQVYSDPSVFLQRAQAMLEAREAENNLMLGAALRMCEHPDWVDTPPYLAMVEDEPGRLAMAAAIMPPRMTLLAANPALSDDSLDGALAELVQNLRQTNWQVPGVNAETRLSEHFAKAWEKSTGKTSRLKTRLRIYELRQVIPPPHPPPGSLRIATQEDFEIVTRWHLAFSLEAVGDGSLEESQKQAARYIAAGNIYLWDDNGPVSMAARARPTPHGCTVNGVYTPPSLRGKGYASACVAALSQLLLNSGYRFCDLFTNLSNPTSNAIYQKIGYRPVCDFSEFVFEGPD